MNNKTLILTLLLAATPSMAMSASVYTWTDEQGVTHFGDRQPPGTRAKTLNVRSGTSSGNGRSSPQKRLSELQEQQQKNAEQKQETVVETANRKQRVANCENARSNLKVIESNARIRIEDNGQMRYLSPEEIAEQRSKLEKIAAENCQAKDQQ